MRNSLPTSCRTRRNHLSTARLMAGSRAVVCTARLLVAGLFVLSLGIHPVTAAAALANSTDSRICDTDADYFLGIEDYAKAIRSHETLLKSQPNNALAHYHLGFAYGMTGRQDVELREYLRAIDLGLTKWDLFMNLGLVYLGNGSIQPAIRALYLATVISPTQPSAHFNLALAYEHAGMLDQAKEEVFASIGLDSQQADAWNTLAVIYAEQGDRARAGKLWFKRFPTTFQPETTCACCSGLFNRRILSPTLQPQAQSQKNLLGEISRKRINLSLWMVARCHLSVMRTIRPV